MKITFMINSLTHGGAEKVVLTLAEKFLHLGDEVTILSLNKNDIHEIPKGVKVIYITSFTDKQSSGVIGNLNIPYYAWKVRQYSKRENIEIIQSHIDRANFVNVLSRLIGAKHQTQIVSHEISSNHLKKGFLGRLHVGLIRYFYKRADLVITISKKMLEDLNTLVALSNKQLVINNPYNIETIEKKANEPIDSFTFDEHKKYLITIGKLLPLKQFDHAIKALAKLPQHTELLILGADGGELANLQALASKLGVEKRVHFLEHLANPFNLLKRADIFLLTSRTEGFPNVLIEAMICKTAIVSTDCVSGPREILAPESNFNITLTDKIEQTNYGTLYPVGSIEHLVEAIELLLNNENDVTTIEKAYERGKSFSSDHIVQEYSKILKP